jgi:hypothetical protein
VEKLKLFVVGHHSGDPDDWPDSGEWLLVCAENADEAFEVAGDLARLPVTVVILDSPTVIVHHAFLDRWRF